MRDHDRRAAFHQARQRIANPQFGFGVDARGGFVQNQIPRTVRQRAGETDELLLAGGKSGAALAHGLIETLRQRIE